ncbi:MAG: DUF4493 domain-containing protein [Bacteroidales bacterium]|nr:DUF4493 domain-containing protein [Bacteroidales bacterium]
MKRFVAVGIASAMLLAACNLLSEKESAGRLSISFAEPVITQKTKSALPDTANFILTVKSVTGELVYNGLYGHRPTEMQVAAGTYEVAVVSSVESKPAFDAPIYGDAVTVVVSNGQSVDVRLLCKQLNAGVRFTCSERFRQQYAGSLLISHADGNLEYGYEESRYAYFAPGNLTVQAASNGMETLLFNKVLTAGVNLSLNLDASAAESSSKIEIGIDTTAIYQYEDIVVGDHFEGEDGRTLESALSVESAKKHVGDTIWVWGYIVGGFNSSAASGLSFTPPFSSASALVIASAQGVSDKSWVMSVTLASGSKIRDAVNLVEHPEAFQTKIFVKGVIVESYLGLTGIKPVKDFGM